MITFENVFESSETPDMLTPNECFKKRREWEKSLQIYILENLLHKS